MLDEIPPKADEKAFSSGMIRVHGPNLAAALRESRALYAFDLLFLRPKPLEGTLGYGVCKIHGEVYSQVLEC